MKLKWGLFNLFLICAYTLLMNTDSTVHTRDLRVPVAFQWARSCAKSPSRHCRILHRGGFHWQRLLNGHCVDGIYLSLSCFFLSSILGKIFLILLKNKMVNWSFPTQCRHRICTYTNKLRLGATWICGEG
jgi:hypothetical protein